MDNDKTQLPNIAFIGCGNMGSSLISGLLKSGYPGSAIRGSEPDEEKRKQLNELYKIELVEQNVSAVKDADIIVLAIKPQILIDTLDDIKHSLPKDCLIISIAAGISTESIANTIGTNKAIIRVMPNTPSLINCGAAGMFANSQVSEQQKQQAEDIINSVGLSIWLETEDLIDVVTAISGSGPAYYFLFMEMFEQAAIEMGLNQQQAQSLIQQTALGAAKMAIHSEESVAQLRKNVSSPGGTTEAAIQSFINSNLEQVIKTALLSAENRSKKLSQLFGNNKTTSED